MSLSQRIKSYDEKSCLYVSICLSGWGVKRYLVDFRLNITFFLREDISRKKTFSFGHCPNHLNPPLWSWYEFLFSPLAKSLQSFDHGCAPPSRMPALIYKQSCGKEITNH